MLAFVPQAIVSGLFAALASLVAKMAMAGRETLELCESLEVYLRVEKITDSLECQTIIAYIRLACFLGVILCNTIMWTVFSKALQKSQNSVEPVVVNTGANFFFSALFGFIIYHESLSLMWCMGASLILIGLVTISHGGVQLVDDEDIKLD